MTGQEHVIQAFRRGHQTIVASIDQVQIHARSYGAIRYKLMDLNEKILLHLSRQDDKFYEKLTAFYAHDRSSLKMLEFLIHDLKSLKIKYLMFFDKYPGGMGDSGSVNFQKDFREFADSLITRFNMEEEYLFPLIRKTEKQDWKTGKTRTHDII